MNNSSISLGDGNETSSSSTRPLPPPNRRRDKPQLSCNLCRKRKLKCDRGQPCETCVKRGVSRSCTYVNSNAGLEHSDRSISEPESYSNLKERIAELEVLVSAQFKGSGNGESTEKQTSDPRAYSRLAPVDVREQVPQNQPSQGVSPVSEPSIHLRARHVDDGERSRANWTTILDSIGELKDVLGDDYVVDEMAVPDREGPALLFEGQSHIDKQDLLAAIPPRPIVDRLISKCFNSVEIVPVIVHSQTFLNQYECFWSSPQETSVIWIGLLFGMLSLALLHQETSSGESSQQLHFGTAADTQCLIDTFREKTSQCLILGNYTKGKPYTIETLILYMHAEFVHIEHAQKDEPETGLWIILGTIVRLALYLGFHRDGTHDPRMSPFEAEMRRRIWTAVYILDASLSTQCGLPRMIRASQCNTAEPCNLLNEDIQVDMTELPAARLEFVQTPVAFLMAKKRLVSALGKVSDLITLVQEPQYSEILRIDGILHSAYDSIPSWLTMRPMAKSILDNPTVIQQRITLVLQFYKAKCLLHRPYLMLAQNERRYRYSYTACIEAALELLKTQQILYQETKTAGRLHGDRARLSLFGQKDFLLATLILCADVGQTIARMSTEESQGSPTPKSPNEDVISALHAAYPTWLASIESSREAKQAARVLRAVLGRCQQMNMEASSKATPELVRNEHPNTQMSPKGQHPALDRPCTINADVIASNPTLIPDLPRRVPLNYQDILGMTFPTGHPREPEEYTQGDQTVPNSVSRQFGWILPGGGKYDAF